MWSQLIRFTSRLGHKRSLPRPDFGPEPVTTYQAGPRERTLTARRLCEDGDTASRRIEVCAVGGASQTPNGRLWEELNPPSGAHLFLISISLPTPTEPQDPARLGLFWEVWSRPPRLGPDSCVRKAESAAEHIAAHHLPVAPSGPIDLTNR